MDMYSISKSQVGYQAAFAGKPRSYKGIGYIRERLVGCQTAIAGKPRSYKGIGYICERLVGCQAAFASKPAPTVDRVNLKDHVRLETAIAGKPRSYRGIGSTNRPSVSSPALDLDPPAPFGRLSAGVHPGIGAQRRAAKPHTLHVGAAKQTGGQCPRMNAAAKERRALARGRTLGASLLVPFWRLKKGLAVRAKP